MPKLRFVWLKPPSCSSRRSEGQTGALCSVPTYLSLSLRRFHPSLLSHDLFTSFSASSTLLFLPLLHPFPCSLYSCLPLSYIFCSSLSLISLPAFPEETVNSGFTVMVKREQGLKKKPHCGLYYHQLRCTGQLCPQCPSFCVTLMWPVKRESYHRRFKVTQEGVCSRRTWNTKDFHILLS